MTKEDFYPGQKVYLLQVLNFRDKTLDQRITEVEVKSVGRRYVTVNFYGNMKFDISINFKEVTEYTPNYRLYLKREDIDYEMKRLSDEEFVRKEFGWERDLAKKMSDDDLAAVIAVIQKYVG